MHRMLISAAHKSSGKTTVSIGLCKALSMRGLSVQPYKKGPDYIDPMWLSQACGRACRNLDLYLMERDDVVSTFARNSSDINLVEGNKGLYDGLALDGSNSNAELAKLLDLPVVLVIDARGMTRGIAPLILGYQAFDRNIHIAGVILNNLGGSRHEAKLREVIEHYTDVPVLGAIQHDERLLIAERHLGLMPSNESGESAKRIHEIGTAIANQVDLDQLLALSAKEPLPVPATPSLPNAGGSSAFSPPEKLRIGIARDRAFGFYYADDLDALTAAGAELVPFDTIGDAHLPDVDALYIGGGFPEIFAGELAANSSLRAEIRQAIGSGMPAYAECGGLMYLARTLRYQGKIHEMAGVIPGDVVMHNKPVGRGYVHLAENQEHPWPRPHVPAKEIRAHEFHYSSLENLPSDTRFAYRVTRGHGICGKYDGLIRQNLLASYTHLRTIGSCYWAARFVAFVRQVKQRKADFPMRAARLSDEGSTMTNALSGKIVVGDKVIETDSEGYIKNLDEWSEAFAIARAEEEGLALTDEHWQVIHYLRDYYQEHGVQAQVRVMIPHFREAWGEARGNNHYLHELFPIGGPQKQGNRLAGLLRTKGEH